MPKQDNNDETEKQVKHHYPDAGNLPAEPLQKDQSNNRAFTIAISFALLIIVLSLIFYSFNLSSQLNNAESELAELQNEIAHKNEMLDILESDNIELISMSGMEANPGGSGRIILDSENQMALLLVSNLPVTPEDRDYQLWIINSNNSISAGVFTVTNSDDNNFFIFENLPDISNRSISAFTVTLEPKGGIDQPSGDMYLMGNLDR